MVLNKNVIINIILLIYCFNNLICGEVVVINLNFNTKKDETNLNFNTSSIGGPSEYECPISAATMTDPVILKDSGHTVDRASVAKQARDPFTRGPLVVVSNNTLKSIIQTYPKGLPTNNIPNEIMCPIKGSMFIDPVVLPASGITVEREAALEMIKGSGRDLLSNDMSPLTEDDLIKNRTLNDLIESYVKQLKSLSVSSNIKFAVKEFEMRKKMYELTLSNQKLEKDQKKAKQLEKENGHLKTENNQLRSQSSHRRGPTSSTPSIQPQQNQTHHQSNHSSPLSDLSALAASFYADQSYSSSSNNSSS